MNPLFGAFSGVRRGSIARSTRPRGRVRPIAFEPVEKLEDRRLLSFLPFDAAMSRPVFSTPDPIHATANADIDADGDLDLIVSAGPRIHTLLNDGLGRFTLASTMRISGRADQLVLGDFDGDGDNDLAALGLGPNIDKFLRVFTSDRDGTWTRTQTIKLNANQVQVGNFDTDTRRELVAVFDHSITIYQMNVGIPNAPRGGPNSLFNIADAAVQDMDADGISDVVVGLNAPSGTPEAVVSVWTVKAGSFGINTALDRTDARVQSVSAVHVIGSNRPDVIVSGMGLNGSGIDTPGVWVVPMTSAVGQPLAFGSPQTIYTQVPPKVEVTSVVAYDIDVLGARNMNGDMAGSREVVFTWKRTITNNATMPATVSYQRYLSIAERVTDSSFNVYFGPVWTGSNDNHAQFATAPFQTASPAFPDLLYTEFSLLEGGKNKVRYAENNYIV
ncbi:MAG TPA: VCBS repeat-containing protein [Phycisphaerales bacterium]|nr:VCBS repeat-containing protein [Phycisphaerales bacterium]